MAARKEGIPSLKVVMLGDASIGAKTSLIDRFVRNAFADFQETIIWAGFVSKSLTVDGIDVNLELWGLHTQQQREKVGHSVDEDEFVCTQTQRARKNTAHWRRCSTGMRMLRFWALT